MENEIKTFTKKELENGNDPRITEFFEKNENLYTYATSHVEEIDVATVEFLGKNKIGNAAMFEANTLMEKHAPVGWFNLLIENQTEPGTLEKIVEAFEENIDVDTMAKYIEMSNSDFELGKLVKDKPEIEEPEEVAVEESAEPEEETSGAEVVEKTDNVTEESTEVSEKEELVEESIEQIEEVTSEALTEDVVLSPLDIMQVLKKDTDALVNDALVNESLKNALECITTAAKYQSESKNLVDKMKSQLVRQEDVMNVLAQEKKALETEIDSLKIELSSVKNKKEYYEEKYNQLAEKIQSASLLIN